MHLHVGEKFIVIGTDDTVILKKIENPSFKGFDKILKKTRDFVKKKGLTPGDVGEVIKRVRAQ